MKKLKKRIKKPLLQQFADHAKKHMKLFAVSAIIVASVVSLAYYSFSYATVIATPATGGTNIATSKAVDGTSPQYSDLGNIIIQEGATNPEKSDFTPNQSDATLILSAPQNRRFKAGSGSVTCTMTPSAGDFTSCALNVTSSTITVTFSNASNGNKRDTMTIGGIQVQAISGSLNPSTGYIYRSTSTPGTAAVSGITTTANTDGSGGTNFATLSQQITDVTPPTASVSYNPASLTNQNVVATLTGASETLTGVNATGYTFTGNGSFVFTFQDLAGNTGSATATVTWIDKTAPTASVSYSPNSTTSGNVTATLVGASETLTGLNASNHVFTGNGSFEFTFQDLAGNTGSATATVNWIDKTAPTASVSYNPASLTNQDVIATLTGASEAITITNNSGNSGYTFTSNGSFVFTFQDTAGNTGSTTATVNWIDKVPPTASVSYSTTGATSGSVIATFTGASETITGLNATGHTFTSNGSFEFTFQDLAGNTGSTTATVSWITDLDSPTASVSYNPSSLTNQDVVATLTGASETLTGINATGYTFTGNGSFEFTFQDLAGNTGSATATVSWIDKTAPTASVSYSTTGATNQDVIVTLTNQSETLTGLNATGYTFTSNGSFEFTFQDLAGNTGSVTANVSWIDKTAPTASVSYNPASITNQDVVSTLTGASEAITITNNGGLNQYVFSANGSFEFTFQDAAGNTGSATATVDWINKASPTATIEYDISTLTNGNVVAQVTGYSETGITITNNGGSDSYTFTGNGVFTFELLNTAGSTGSVSAMVTWIDKVFPTGTVVYSPNTSTSGNVLATLTGFSETIGGYLFDTYLFTGNGSVVFIFEDLAGNPGSATGTVTWIDRTAPTATVAYSPDTSTTSNVVATLTGASETLTGLNASDYTFTTNGSFIFTFQDLAGNTGSALSEVTWIVTPSSPIPTVPTAIPRGDSISSFANPDVCPNGDNSPSAYDRTCEGKKVQLQSPNKETNNSNAANGECNWSRPSFDCLLERGRAIGLTNATTRTQFGPNKVISRQETARYINTYSNAFSLNATDTSIECTFDDINTATPSFVQDIIQSCQKGLFAGSSLGASFLPKSGLKQSQAITVLVKMLAGQQKESSPWYASYYKAFEKLLPNSEYQMDTYYKNMTRGDLLRLLFTLRYSK